MKERILPEFQDFLTAWIMASERYIPVLWGLGEHMEVAV